MEANHRFVGPETIGVADLLPAHRVAELEFSYGPTLRPGRRAAAVRHRPPRRIRPEAGVTVSIDYSEKIPNNVDLPATGSCSARWSPGSPTFLNWWKTMGPALPHRGTSTCAPRSTSAGRAGHTSGTWPWRKYRWGVFLAERNRDRKIAFGEQKGERSGSRCRASTAPTCKRLIVNPGDTEPASVEQQRRLGETAPSLYDLRNLFQVNVEEGRHLWAMVYLLHAYFGRNGPGGGRGAAAAQLR